LSGTPVAIEVAKSHAEVIRTLILPDASIEMPVPDTAEAKEASEFTQKVIGTLQKKIGGGPDGGVPSRGIVFPVGGRRAFCLIPALPLNSDALFPPAPR
jgi:hypothetical protein